MAEQDERVELDVQPEGTAEEQPVAPTGAGETEAAAPQPARPISPPVDLTQLPEFRKYQSERDRREAEHQQKIDALLRRASELERQQYELATAGMSAADKAKYENQMLRRQLQHMEQGQAADRQRLQLRAIVDTTLKELGLKEEDVPPGEFPDPWTWQRAAAVKAMEKAKAAAEKKGEKEKQKVAARREATAVDTGSAAPAGGELGDLKQQLRELRGTGQITRALEIQREIERLTG